MAGEQQDAGAHGVVMSTTDGDGSRLRLVGRLDERAVDRLRALLDDVPVSAHVRIDLSRAAGLPLAVLRVLAAAHRRLGVGGGSFVVVDPSPAAALALRTSGLDRALVVLAAAAPLADAAVS
jgi:anti-anti-sigma regulatory factor